MYTLMHTDKTKSKQGTYDYTQKHAYERTYLYTYVRILTHEDRAKQTA